MRYVIDQDTTVVFPHPVREHHCELRLMPADGPTQRLHAAHLEIEPAAALGSQIDYFGNTVHHCDIVAPHARLRARLHVEVETLLGNPFDYQLLSPHTERTWLAETLKAQPRLWDYVLHRSERVPAIARITGEALEWPQYDPGRALLDSVHLAREWLADTLAYEPGEPGTSLDAVLAAGAGSAVDFAHLFIALIRSWQCAARYVRGYIDPTNFDDDDAVATPHAWAEVLIPGAGWRGFDPTTRLVVNDSYVAVAVGRDCDDVPLQRSAFKGDDQPAAVPQVSLRMSREAAQQ
jgi:transglutaminase-like putative cysteine protease